MAVQRSVARALDGGCCFWEVGGCSGLFYYLNSIVNLCPRFACCCVFSLFRISLVMVWLFCARRMFGQVAILGKTLVGMRIPVLLLQVVGWFRAYVSEF